MNRTAGLVLLVLLGVDSRAPSHAGEFQVNSYTLDAQAGAAVAATADGRSFAVWHSVGQDGSGLGVFGQRYDAAGSPAGAEFQINSYVSIDQMLPEVAMQPAGDALVVWQSYYQDGDDQGVFAQRYDSGGTAVGGEFQVSTATLHDQRWPAVAPAGDGFLTAWEGEGQDGFGAGIFAQVYDGSGVAVGGEIQVNTHILGDQLQPALAADANGAGIIAWDSIGQDGSGSGVFARRYDSAGAMLGAEFQVNTNTAGSQALPAVGMHAGGGFLVAWQSEGQDGSGFGIFAQRYDSDAAAVGSEFRVNSHVDGHQRNPSVSADLDVGYAVAWSSEGQDGSESGVFGQRYDGTGTALGTEFQLNSYVAATQAVPALVSAAGDVVALWSSTGGQDGSSTGVFGRRLPPDLPCPPSPAACTGGFAKGILLVNEKAVGRERLVVKMLGGPQILQAEFGDPLAPFGTRYDLCIYDDTPSLVVELAVSRPGDATCSGGSRPCWRPIGAPPSGRGYRYKDAAAAADGAFQILLKGGASSAGRSKILVKGRGAGLPLPIAATLTSATSVTVQLHADDAPGTGCFEVALSNIKKQTVDSFGAR